MGLDWNPMARPTPGNEPEFERLLQVDLDSLDDAGREAAMVRFSEISEAPFETLGAPRVGFDPAADAWLLERLRDRGKEKAFAKVAADMHGYHVLDLLPASPGLPVYGSEGYEGVDRYTFRGKFLDDARAVIGDELYTRAWERMTPAELGAYGDALLAAGRRYAASQGLEALEHQRDAPDDDQGTPPSIAHIVFSAAAWCRWWADRGHGLEPYF